MEQLEGSWKRKVLELDGLTEELSGVFDKVERSRKSIAARQSKENAQAPPVPQTPEEMHHQLMLLARSQGHPV